MKNYFTGFKDLDSITNGFQTSDLILIASRPAMGKTAFAINLILNFIKNYNIAVAIFSMELSKEQLIQRMVCSDSEVNFEKLKTGNLELEDWHKLTKTFNKLAEAPIYIDDTVDCSVAKVKRQSSRLLEEKSLGLIMIDYLQLMEGVYKNEKYNMQQISKISKELKSLANELNIPIIVLSQLPRTIESRTDKSPVLTDSHKLCKLKQNFDIVILLYRKNYYKLKKTFNNSNDEIAEITVAKNKKGKTNSFKLVFKRNIIKFKNINDIKTMQAKE